MKRLAIPNDKNSSLKKFDQIPTACKLPLQDVIGKGSLSTCKLTRRIRAIQRKARDAHAIEKVLA
jgi:hypothetical protein